MTESLSGTAPNEDELLTALRRGEEKAFACLVRQLSGGLLRMATSYGLSVAVAEEIVQETWVVVITTLHRFEGRSSLSTWVYSILINLARRAGVKERRAVPFSSVWRNERQPAVAPERFHGPGSRDGAAGTWSSMVRRWDLEPAARLESAEVRAVIDDAVAALPLRQREVFVSRDLIGMEPDEVCAALSLSAGNQRVLLHRARSRVRQSLETYFDDSAREDTP